jgi:two-component system sensor histidine kinase KdpD
MEISTRTYRRIIGVMTAIVAVAFTTIVLVPLRDSVNSTTIALVYLLVAVLVSTFFQRWAALTSAILAALAFNYFFLPPLYTLTIAEPQNLVSLFVFLAVAITVGHLSAVSNKRRAEAEQLYKELEEAFEVASEAEALRRSEKFKSAMLDAVTHDFRTPLTSIKASVTMLIDENHLGSDRGLDRHARGELLEVINEESDRLNTFVESMVELARFQSGESALLKATVTPEEIVVKAARRAKSLRPRHKLISAVEPGLPALSVDSRAIVEAVYNLLDNAAKFSPAGSPINISASSSDENVRFSIEDEGQGIPESERESVFERFYRSDKNNGRPGGLGMGLAIVRGIIEAHGGHIWVESGKQGGSRFVFDLPAARNG